MNPAHHYTKMKPSDIDIASKSGKDDNLEEQNMAIQTGPPASSG